MRTEGLGLALATMLPTLGLAAPPEPNVVVLGILRGERPDPKAAAAVIERLHRIGEPVFPKSLERSSCDLADDECLLKLAPKGARELIYGEIRPLGSANSFEVTLRRISVASAKTVAEQTERCESCDDKNLEAKTAWLAGSLYDRMAPLPPLHEIQGPPAKVPAMKPNGPPPNAPPPVPTPALPKEGTPQRVAPPKTVPLRKGFTPKKAALSGSFGTLATLGLAGFLTFVIWGAKGQYPCLYQNGGGLNCPNLDAPLGQSGGLGYGITGAVTLSSAFVFGWAVYTRSE